MTTSDRSVLPVFPESDLVQASTVTAGRPLNVALIQMPFGFTAWPSLGLSLLKAIVEKAGHRAEVMYFSQTFEDRIGPELYSIIARGAPQNVDLLGEWIFAEALSGPDERADSSYLAQVFHGENHAHRKSGSETVLAEIEPQLETLRAAANAVIDELASRNWADFDVVGFTSTFQQNLASLALARRIKMRFPTVRIVFGGANCEGDMGHALLRCFPFIDAICPGEGDLALPLYLEAVQSGKAGGVTGMLTRSEVYVAAERTVLDDLPYPDFDDFFLHAPAGDPQYAERHRLIFESSRGCWWGEKNHCTFCGLNGTTMAFRRKDGGRAIAEIQHLLARYGQYTRNITATDNIIPYDYFRKFLPDLAEMKMELSLFYETKSNLRKEQIALYRAAGLTAIQPGIESLSTPVLKIMRKGVSALQNIQALKWCVEYGVEAKWNALAGFPGEQPDWYADLPSLVMKLNHLEPPVGVSTLRFDRFSPYHSAPESFGLSALEPYPAYAQIYRGVDPSELQHLAYYFVTDYPEGTADETYAREAFAQMELWRKDGGSRALIHIDSDAGIVVFDLRGDTAKVHVLQGIDADVFAETDQITGRGSLCSSLERTEAVARLLELGLLIEEDGKYLNISVALTEALRLGAAAKDRMRALFTADGDWLAVDPAYVSTYATGRALVREAV
ncbi:MAG: RiPP maturation radical SAM C-methyltransferase [Rhizobium sp.]|nr:RiPP maturation radical SAM C-methyltransferase [Rhizobium sp.]